MTTIVNINHVVAISEILVEHGHDNWLGNVLDIYALAFIEATHLVITDDIFLMWLECVCSGDEPSREYAVQCAWLDGALAAVMRING